jgi:hypothetical protein
VAFRCGGVPRHLLEVRQQDEPVDGRLLLRQLLQAGQRAGQVAAHGGDPCRPDARRRQLG